MKRKLVLLVHIFLLFTSLSSAQRLKGTPPRIFSDPIRYARAEAYADSLLKKMSIEEMTAQLIMPMIYPSNSAKDLQLWDHVVKSKKYGGVLWQKGNPNVVIQLTNRMRASAPHVPMLVAMDGEWGLSMRISNTIKWPRNIVLGASNDTQLAYDYGRATATEAKRLGIHVNFAPVLDVNSNPLNPVIGTRSFGSNPDRVIALGLAYARGLEDNGVLSTAKHFPGHGDTETDSHKTLPVITKSLDELKQMELRPFQSYIDAGLGGMMVGHLSIPALGTGSRATSASKSIVTDLLQNQMRFDGLIFTDGLAMKGIISGAGGNSVAVEVFNAGSDILLAPEDPDKAFDDLMKAIKAKVISKEEVRRRTKKILMWKYFLNVTDRRPISTANLINDLNSAESKKLLSTIFEKSVTLLKNANGALPLKNKRVALLQYGNAQVPTFAETLKPADVFTVSTGGNHTAIYDKLKKYDLVVVSIASRNARPNASLNQLTRQVPTVLAFFTSPYTITKFAETTKAAKSVAIAYETKTEAQRALAIAMLGKIEFFGKLPVDLSPIFREGTGLKADFSLPTATAEEKGLSSEKLQKIDRIVEDGLRANAYPGCQVLIAKDGAVVFHKAYGFKDSAKKEPNDTKTLYDLASVTKAISSISLVMVAKDEKKLNENDRIGKFLPYLQGSDKANIPMSNLLYHVAGLPAVLPFYNMLIDKDSYKTSLSSSSRSREYPNQIGDSMWVRDDFEYMPDLLCRDSSSLFPVRFAKGFYLSPKVRDNMRTMIKDATLRRSGYIYSDIDFLLVQDVVESIYKKPLDELFEEKIAGPLNAHRLLFKPYTRYQTSEIAEGTKEPFLRKQTLRGDVDDEAAAMLGGVSGNAGLYGNAEDVAKVLFMLDNKGELDGTRVIEASTVQRFTNAHHPTSPYSLGFNRLARDGKPSNKVPKAPLSTYGHTGFTGTCFWVDPENHIVYVFLSNRVAPRRWVNRLQSMDIRNKILSTVYDAML